MIEARALRIISEPTRLGGTLPMKEPVSKFEYRPGRVILRAGENVTFPLEPIETRSVSEVVG